MNDLLPSMRGIKNCDNDSMSCLNSSLCSRLVVYPAETACRYVNQFVTNVIVQMNTDRRIYIMIFVPYVGYHVCLISHSHLPGTILPLSMDTMRPMQLQVYLAHVKKMMRC